MAQSAGKNCFRTMRRTFALPKGHNVNIQQWFPRHMYGGMRHMQARLRVIDYIIEVHDARIPLTGRNFEFNRQLYTIRPHMLVLNKCDLIDYSYKSVIETELRKREPKLTTILWTNCKDGEKCIRIVQKMKDTIVKDLESAPRFHRDLVPEYSVMVVGIPNVGKSSLINLLRRVNLKEKGEPAKVGPKPGVTVKVQNKIKISESPRIYIEDTPGILAPQLKDLDIAMKLVLCHNVADHQINSVFLADYLLFWLNKTANFSYIKLLDLYEPCDDIHVVLLALAQKFNCVRKYRDELDNLPKEVPDVDVAARTFIEKFRSGKLGRLLLDEDLIGKVRKEEAEGLRHGGYNRHVSR